jgi:hypothetical protein
MRAFDVAYLIGPTAEALVAIGGYAAVRVVAFIGAWLATDPAVGTRAEFIAVDGHA